MSSFNSFAPFNEDNLDTPSIINRTLEEVISERGEFLNIHFSNESCLQVNYNILFEKIKSKLLIINNQIDLNISDCPIIEKYREDFLKLKKDVCDIYLNYMKVETELNEAKEKYTTFCESIKNCVNFIYNTGTQMEQDTLIKELLEEKIESYYIKLDIDNLIKKHIEKSLEFEKIKYKMSMISGTIIPTITCQVCLENQIEYFVDPCGHTICKVCKVECEKLKNCHYCRTPRNGYKRLYL